VAEPLAVHGRPGPPLLAGDGGVYCVVAVKRVQGMRLMSPSWRKSSVPAGMKAPVTQRQPPDMSWRNKEEN
jgi:hypothetical protein